MTPEQKAAKWDELSPYELKVLQAMTFEGDTKAIIGQRVWGDKKKSGGLYTAQGLARMAGKFIHQLHAKGLVTTRRRYEGSNYTLDAVSQRGRAYLESRQHHDENKGTD